MNEDSSMVTEGYEKEISRLKNRINELSALLYQVLEQVDSDLFNDHMSNVNRQNLIRLIKQRVPLTSDILAIVNKSREQQKQPVNEE